MDPVKNAKNAQRIAEEMGLPDYLKYKDHITRTNDAFVALKFQPDASDQFYRPTFLDAIDHIAFRPGPTNPKDYRYGLTRKCQVGGAAPWEQPVILPRKGRREVVMKNRQAILPSDTLTVDAILFFE